MCIRDREKADKIKAEGYSDDEIRKLCHTKDHDCATVVEHPVWGKGKPILKSHAIPDDNGFVEWYDVQFKHGIERKVMAKDMVIEAHNGHGKEEDMEMQPEKMKKVDLVTAMKDMADDKHTKDELVAMYNGMKDATKKEVAHDDEKEDEEEVDEKVKKEYYKVDVKKDVDALVEGENFSEDFKAKASTIFEAAVSSKIKQLSLIHI